MAQIEKQPSYHVSLDDSAVSADSGLIALEELSDADFLSTVEDFQTEMKHLTLENQVFENFILANEPTLITAMDKILESAMKVKTKQYRPLHEQPFESPEQSDQTSVFRTSIRGSVAGGYRPRSLGPRINISQKTDLVLREIEEMQIQLEKFITKSHKIKFKLKAEIEESAIRALEVNEAKEIFEQSIVIDAVDKLTQKIPAEKFVRYMQEWLKSAQFTLEKLRLRTSSIKIQYNKLKNLLAQKEEIGECVHEVDFEKLRIENKHLLLKIDQKNNHLLELKRMNGKANLMLTTHKKVLQQQAEDLNKIEKAVSDSEKRIADLEAEADLAEEEIQSENEKLEKMQDLIKNYRVPDVIEYINKKYELEELRKLLKTWNRKCTIQKTAIETYTRNMKHITGINKPRPSWFDLFRKTSEINFFDDYGSSSNTSSVSELPQNTNLDKIH